MAASSSSTFNGCFPKFSMDVFLNYQEVDARTFARSLYNRLSLNYREVDVRTCEDLRQELQVGYNLKQAIKTARVHVVILSPRFAESKSCLRELVMMLLSNAPIIPVFYRVQRSEVSGYAREMLAEEIPLPIGSEEIDFLYALSHVATINKGFELDTFNGELEEVVNVVRESLEEVVNGVRESLEEEKFQVWYGNPWYGLEEVEDESLIFNF